LAPTFDSPLFSSDQSVDRVLNAGLPVALVFVDGQAPAALYETMKSLAKQHAGQLLVVQLSLKDSQQTARRFGIAGAPGLATVREGQAHSQAAPVTGSELAQHVRYLLGQGPKPEPTETGSPGAPGGYASQPPGDGRPVTVTDATFEQEVMRSAIPVVVDFWAPWCGPCRMVAPTLDKLAREWSGQVKIAKVNVDENPLVGERYGIQAIPTMMVVKNGRIVERWSGALPEQPLRSRLAPLVR
jgi:thioredoxin 1